MRFWRVPVQIPREVPESSGEDTCSGSGGFCAVPECRYLVRFWTVPVQIPCEVPEVSGAGSVRFRRVAVQILG